MDINQLIKIVKKKINQKISCKKIEIKDNTFLHESHKNYQDGKFHIKLEIKSLYLNKMNKIESTKIIYKILDEELKKYIHSIQILIN
jgi:BolA protein|tara:strand:+ start:69 stop:329 length:261 start_codon:yes stop_codon:yes gene_type:complete